MSVCHCMYTAWGEGQKWGQIPRTGVIHSCGNWTLVLLQNSHYFLLLSHLSLCWTEIKVNFFLPHFVTKERLLIHLWENEYEILGICFRPLVIACTKLPFLFLVIRKHYPGFDDGWPRIQDTLHLSQCRYNKEVAGDHSWYRIPWKSIKQLFILHHINLSGNYICVYGQLW